MNNLEENCMRKTKQLLALALVLVMVLSGVPLVATEEDTFLDIAYDRPTSS